MSTLHLKPAINAAAASELARSVFGVSGAAVELTGERDQNFRIDVAGQARYVLKLANGAEDRGLVEAQHLAMAAGGPLCPTPVTSAGGHAIESVTIDGRLHLVRMLTWLGGVPMGCRRRRTPALFESLGRAVASVDRGLAHVDHPALHRAFEWDLATAPAILAGVPAHVSTAGRSLIRHALALHAAQVAPRAAALPQQAVHGDANDHNVLVGGGSDLYTRGQSVVGLIDFGDMIWSARVHDLAVAAAYALLGHDEELAAVAHVVRGYHAELPLTAEEVAVVFPLVLLRLALSVHHAALQTYERPDDPYLAISQAPIRTAIPRLLAIHPRLADYTLRAACGLDPVPHAPAIVSWLREHAGEMAPVLGRPLDAPGAAVPVDLSAGSALVTSDPAGQAPATLAARLSAAIAGRHGAQPDAVGIGGYGEPRVIYTAPAFQGHDPFAEAAHRPPRHRPHRARRHTGACAACGPGARLGGRLVAPGLRSADRASNTSRRVRRSTRCTATCRAGRSKATTSARSSGEASASAGSASRRPTATGGRTCTSR